MWANLENLLKKWNHSAMAAIEDIYTTVDVWALISANK